MQGSDMCIFSCQTHASHGKIVPHSIITLKKACEFKIPVLLPHQFYKVLSLRKYVA